MENNNEDDTTIDREDMIKVVEQFTDTEICFLDMVFLSSLFAMHCIEAKENGELELLNIKNNNKEKKFKIMAIQYMAWLTNNIHYPHVSNLFKAKADIAAEFLKDVKK